jgi:hypothetical protein
LSLPSVGEKTLGKELFAECCICDTRQRALCRVSKKDTQQRNSLPSVKNKTLGKELLRRVFSFTEGFLRGARQRALCRVPEIKYSAKNMALGKEPNSSSDTFVLYDHNKSQNVKNETKPKASSCCDDLGANTKLISLITHFVSPHS